MSEICRFCDRPIWLNIKSGEWFHEVTAERVCNDLIGSVKALPAEKVS